MPHEGLAGIKEDLTALDDHALDGQVLPDVLCLADFIVHDPGETGHKRHAVPLPGRGRLCSLLGVGPAVRKVKAMCSY